MAMQDDESLQRWKQSLGIGAGASGGGEKRVRWFPVFPFPTLRLLSRPYRLFSNRSSFRHLRSPTRSPSTSPSPKMRLQSSKRIQVGDCFQRI